MRGYFYWSVVAFVCLHVISMTRSFATYTYHPFSIASSQVVYFSPGNLQYNAMLGTHKTADGKIKKGTWRFAEHQWDFVGSDSTMDPTSYDAVNCGEARVLGSITPRGTVYYNGIKSDNLKIAEDYNGWIDLFGFATSGWENSGAKEYEPWATSGNNYDYFGGHIVYNTGIFGEYANADWGVYNEIVNGKDTNPPNMWFTPKALDHWSYIIEERKDKDNNALFGRGTIIVKGDSIPGLILLPDDWINPKGIAFNVSNDKGYESNVFSEYDWYRMESQGAVFLPVTCYRFSRCHIIIDIEKDNSRYWSSQSHYDAYEAATSFFFKFNRIGFSLHAVSGGAGVRLVTYAPPSVMLPHDTIERTICKGSNYFWNDSLYTMPGTYTEKILSYNYNQLDTIRTLILNWDSVYQLHSYDTICYFDSPYYWHGQAYTKAGTYHDTLTSSTGCDSIITLHLTTIPLARSDTFATLCPSNLPFTWHGVTLSQPTLAMNSASPLDTDMPSPPISTDTLTYTFTDTLVSSSGCDSVVTLHLTILPAYAQADTAALCYGSQFVWHGKQYSQPGLYADTLQTVSGCDSLCSILLTPAQVYLNTIYDTISKGQTYLWNNKTLSQPGLYVYNLPSQTNCDSIITLSLYVKTNSHHTATDNITTNNNETKIEPTTVYAGQDFIVTTPHALVVQIYNATGQLVQLKQVNKGKHACASPNAPGLYFVKLSTLASPSLTNITKLHVR